MIVDDAIAFAARAHSGQTRKYSGLPYIVHLIEVMTLIHNLPGTTDEMRAAAVLHDVLEDTSTTEDDLIFTFGSEVTSLVIGLTKVPWSGNRATRKARERDRLTQEDDQVHTIKLADIISNCRRIAVDDPTFAMVYLPEQEALRQVLTKGDEFLFLHAKDVIERQSNYLNGGSYAVA